MKKPEWTIAKIPIGYKFVIGRNWERGTDEHDKEELTALRAYWAEQQENNPLTWETLKQMEGKPVWVEADYFEKGWFLVDASLVDIWVTGYDCAEHQLREEDMGVSWQAYRKERG